MRWLAVIFVFCAQVALAVDPSEILDDPELEARAREISQGLRCPVCQNESIDESSAVLSAQLRVLLRERLVAGDSDEEAVDYLVARFGEFILLEPDKRGANLVLWLAAPALFLLALGIGWRAIRARPDQDEALSNAEKAELEKILKS